MAHLLVDEQRSHAYALCARQINVDGYRCIETFRLRVGDYRVIYEVGKDFQLRILVLTVGHRREVYR